MCSSDTFFNSLCSLLTSVTKVSFRRIHFFYLITNFSLVLFIAIFFNNHQIKICSWAPNHHALCSCSSLMWSVCKWKLRHINWTRGLLVAALVVVNKSPPDHSAMLIFIAVAIWSRCGCGVLFQFGHWVGQIKKKDNFLSLEVWNRVLNEIFTSLRCNKHGKWKKKVMNNGKIMASGCREKLQKTLINLGRRW